jgi:hypothetical protein
MTPKELFESLENTGNDYSYFKKGRKYVYFSTGGWSEEEFAELSPSEIYTDPIFQDLCKLEVEE